MEQPYKILLVDDDPDITSSLKPWLQRSGFDVAIAANGAEGLRIKETFQPDVIVLDIDMPVMNGREMLRRLRKTDKIVRVIILSVIDNDLLDALNEGANQVLIKDMGLEKPYTRPELLAYIRSLITDRDGLIKTITAMEGVKEIIKCGALVYDPNSRLFRLNGRELKLNASESDLLLYMMKHKEQILTRDQLFDKVWNSKSAIESRAVDMRIKRLREKLCEIDPNNNSIIAERGLGYRLIC